jgi:flagellar FliJ protein
MKRFTFSLETALEVRRRAEETVQLELAAKLRELREARSAIADVSNQLADMQRDALEQRRGRADIVAFRQVVSYRHALKSAMLAKGREIERLQGEEREIRARLVEAIRQRRAIEAVREKRYQQWRKEYQTEERVVTDEVSQNVFIRRTRTAHD